MIHRNSGRVSVVTAVLRRCRQLYKVAEAVPLYLVSSLHYHVVGLRHVRLSSVRGWLVAEEHAVCYSVVAVVSRLAFLLCEHLR